MNDKTRLKSNLQQTNTNERQHWHNQIEAKKLRTLANDWHVLLVLILWNKWVPTFILIGGKKLCYVVSLSSCLYQKSWCWDIHYLLDHVKFGCYGYFGIRMLVLSFTNYCQDSCLYQQHFPFLFSLSRIIKAKRRVNTTDKQVWNMIIIWNDFILVISKSYRIS